MTVPTHSRLNVMQISAHPCLPACLSNTVHFAVHQSQATPPTGHNPHFPQRKPAEHTNEMVFCTARTLLSLPRVSRKKERARVLPCPLIRPNHVSFSCRSRGCALIVCWRAVPGFGQIEKFAAENWGTGTHSTQINLVDVSDPT